MGGCFLAIVLGSLCTGSETFAPIMWAKLPGKRLILAPRTLAGQHLKSNAPPHKLTIRETNDAVQPYFTSNPDNTISAGDRCVEALHGKSSNAVIVNHCNGRAVQQWKWIPDGHGRHMIQSKNDNLCLSVDDKDTSAKTGILDGILVKLRQCENKASESWMQEAPTPLPMENDSFPSSVRHVRIGCCFLIPGLGVLSLGAWLWRWLAKRRAVTLSKAGMHLSGEHGGRCLIKPMSRHRGCAWPIRSCDMSMQKMVPAVMAMDKGDATPSRRSHSDHGSEGDDKVKKDDAGISSQTNSKHDTSIGSFAVDRSLTAHGDKSVTDMGLPDKLSEWVQKDYRQENVGLIVSDLSGFTRLTREYGIIHVASMIARIRQICLPIIHHYGPLFINTEADDFIVAFPTAAAAVQAAVGMQKIIAKYSASLLSGKNNFALKLSGVGVDFGVGPLMDKQGKLYGKTFSNAYALGEDLCENGQVLVSGNVIHELESNPEFVRAKFQQQSSTDSAQARELAQRVGGLYTLDLDILQSFSIAACDDDRYLPSSLLRLTQLHCSELSRSQSSELDEALRREYIRRKTVLMFQFEYKLADDPATQMRLKFECLRKMRVILSRYHARVFENELFVFDNPVFAVQAALEIREQLRAQTPQHGTPFVFINGYGIHTGDMLLIPGTDVHWGDPVNTASKLGQDLATGGDILISDTLYETIRSNALVQGVKFEPTKLEKSKVTFTCYKASMKAYGDRPWVDLPNSPMKPWHMQSLSANSRNSSAR